MSSQTLTTRAIIQGVDQMSGPFQKMAAGVQRFSMQTQKHLDTVKGSYAALASKVNAVPIIGGGLAGTLGLAGITHQLVEYDRKARQVQALNTMSAREWSAHQSRFNAITDEFGISPEKVLHAAEAYQQLVGSMRGFDEISRVAAKTSRITGTEMAEQVKEVNALARSFKLDATQKHDIERIERSYLVAAKGMMGGAHAFGSAMKAFAPVAAMTGMDFETASAFVQTLGGQFQGGEIGTALKTTLLRVTAPKDPALKAMGAVGLSPLDYLKMDKAKLDNPGPALVKALEAGGFHLKPGADLSKVFKGADLTTPEGRKLFEKQFVGFASEAFGTKTKKGTYKFAGHDRADLMEIQRQFLMGLGGEVDPVKMLHELGKHKDNKWLMNRVWGTEHIAKGMDLLYQAEHYEERLKHIRQAAAGMRYVHRKGSGTLTRADAIDQRFSIVGQWNSPSFQYDRMMGNMQGFWQSMGAKGLNSTLAGAFKHGADFFRQLQYADPKKVQMVAGALMSLAALPVGVFAIKALGSSLGALAAVGMAPVRMMGALGAVPYAMAATGMTRMGAATRLMGATMTGNALMGMGRFVGFLGSIARFTMMGATIGGVWALAENWDQVTAAFANFNKTDVGKGLSASLSKLWGTTKGLAADLVNATDELFKMLGWKSEDDSNGVASALEKMAGWAMSLAGFLNDALTAIRSLFNPDVEPPEWFAKLLDYAKAENRKTLAGSGIDGYGFAKDGWVDDLLGGVVASREPSPGFIDGVNSMFDGRNERIPVIPPGFMPDGGMFNRSTPMSPQELGAAFGEAVDLGPIVVSQGDAADKVGSHVDGSRDAIVSAIDRLGPTMAAAVAGAVASQTSRFGGPANAGQPAGGNATGAKR